MGSEHNTDWREEDYDWHPTALTATRTLSGRYTSSLDSARQDLGASSLRAPAALEEGPRGRIAVKCQVEGCRADLSTLREYHQRYKICEEHLKQHSLIRQGKRQRFCQQCGRFHDLSEFDGEKRSCRTRLQRHNARRRKKVGGSSAQKSPRRKGKVRQNQKDNDTDNEQEYDLNRNDSGTHSTEGVMAKRGFDEVSPGRALKHYGRSESRESTSTLLMGAQHGMQDCCDPRTGQPPVLFPSLPASNQPLRSFLPNAGFTSNNVPLYVGKPVSDTAHLTHFLDRQSLHPFAAGGSLRKDSSEVSPLTTLASESANSEPLLGLDIPGSNQPFLSTAESTCHPHLIDDMPLLHTALRSGVSRLEGEHSLSEQGPPPYRSQEQLFRASIKLPGTPADLWPELSRGLQDIMANPEGYLRKGCVHITVDSIVSHQRCAELDSMELSYITRLLSMDLRAYAQVQWGNRIFNTHGGEIGLRHCTSGIRVAVSAIYGLMPATFEVTSTGIADGDATLLVRSRGRYLGANVELTGQWSWRVTLTEPVGFGFAQIEAVSATCLTPSQVLLVLPCAEAASEVNSMCARLGVSDRQAFELDLGQVVHATAASSCSGRERTYDALKIRALTRQLHTFAQLHGMPALTGMLHTLSAGDEDEAQIPASKASRPLHWLHRVPSQPSMWECALQAVLHGALNVMKSWQVLVLTLIGNSPSAAVGRGRGRQASPSHMA